MEGEHTYFYNKDNLQDILKEHPEYIKVYFKITRRDGKVVLSLSRDSGDQLYLASNKDHDDLRRYLGKRVIEEHPAKTKSEISIAENKPGIVKKPKQQNLFSFIKKPEARS